MVTSIKRDEIFDKHGRPLVVSTVLMPDGRYQTAVLRKDYIDLELADCDTKACALQTHEKWVKKYARNPSTVEKPLSAKYLQLSEQLKKAAQAAREAAVGDDGGTCNNDCLELRLPRFAEQDTLRAIAAAGLRGRKTYQFGRSLYLVRSPVPAQGNAQTRQAEKMRDVMQDAGYDAGVWYQID